MTHSLLPVLRQALGRHGLILRGGFYPGAGDALDSGTGTVLLVGNAGPAMWEAFVATAPEGPHPLDRWTRTVVDLVAEQVGAGVAYPFDGPPYRPFQRWALHCDDVHPSPMGVLVHPRFGPWHAYRAALLLADRIALPDTGRSSSPCDSCASKPCLDACPVGAFSADGYDVPACTGHIRSAAGAPCVARGCLARHACPVGTRFRYTDPQSAFHMAAFERARPR